VGGIFFGFVLTFDPEFTNAPNGAPSKNNAQKRLIMIDLEGDKWQIN